MPSDLPEFLNVSQSHAASLVHGALTGARGPCMVKLRRYDDNHFRAIFRLRYFDLRDGATSPSKSQWNTLKKRLKRRDRRIFVFRRYGQLSADAAAQLSAGEPCCYIDFGFLA